MITISLNQTVSADITVKGSQEYEISIPTSAKYVVQMGGAANVLFGIWKGSFAPGNGMLRVCGVARQGCRILPAGNYVIEVTGNTAGAYTLQVRPWSFFDYFTINFYKSTC